MSWSQQGVQDIRVEIAFGSSAYDYVFIPTDVTQYVRSVSITRGKTDDFQDFSAGQATVVLDNNDRRFDPSHVAGPYFGLLRPRTRIIVSLVDNSGLVGDDKVIFNGFIGGWPQDYADYGTDATVSLPCYDLMALASQIEMPTDPSQAVILSLANQYTRYYRFGDFFGLGDTVFDANNVNNAYVSAYPVTSTLPPGFVPIGSKLAPSLGGFSSWFIGTSLNPTPYAVVVQAVPTLAPGLRDCAFGGWFGLLENDFDYTTGAADKGFVRMGTFFVGLDATGKIVVRNFGSGGTYAKSVTSVDDGLEHHLMFHYESSTGALRIYIDGVDDTDPATVTLATALVRDDVVFDSTYTSFYAQDWVFYLNGGQVLDTWDSNPEGPEYYPSIHYGVGNNQFLMSTYDRFQLLLRLAEFDLSVWTQLDPAVDYIGECLEFNVDGKKLLQTLQDVARTEQGFLFCNRDGKLRFLPRYAVAQTILNPPVMTFTDNDNDLPLDVDDPNGEFYTGYREFGFDYDDNQLANDVQVVIGSGDSSSYKDETSIVLLGKKSHSIDTLLESTALATYMSEGLTNIYKDPRLKLREMAITPVNKYQAHVLSTMDIGDLIKTVRHPGGIGSTIEEFLTVLQIRHEITPSDWQMYVYASASPVNAFFILDHSELDGPDILGF